MVSKSECSDGVNTIKEYDIKLHETANKNVECPNIEEYTRK